ncbi:MAG: hypothetical protein IJ871_10100 [Ruminococcus sp.]|nr:hypothetical protein [Ruminococcus sp.]
MFKKISAFVAAAALAATMTVTAFATNNEDAVKAAKEAGVQANNVQELDNFLQVHKDCFTSEQYDDMISTLNGIRDKYVAPYCKGGEKQVVDKTPAELTEEDKLVVGKNWTDEDRNAIIDSLVNLGKKYDVVVTVTPVDKAHYTVAAEHKHTDSSSSTTDSKGGTNPAGGTTIKSDTPVANTGAAAGESHTAAAVAAVSLAVAGVGAAVIIKKNKE